MTRVPLESFGRKGYVVNVFAMVLDGEPVARCEWRERDALGALIRRTKTFRGTKRDREEAAKAFGEGTAERLRSSDAPQPAPRPATVGELWDAYVTAHVSDWREKTLVLAKQRWAKFTHHVAPSTPANLVEPKTLDTWRNALLAVDTKRGVPMARNQVAHHIQLVKAVWRFAKRRGLLPDNLLLDYAVKKGRDYEALVVPEYSGHEWGRILGQLDYRKATQWRAWAAIALDGLLATRSNALLRLTWPDIDMTARTVTWPGKTDKVGKTRTQPLPRAAVFVLRVCKVWARRDQYTGPLVFYGAQGRTREKPWTYSALNAALHTAADAVGVKRVPYRAMHSLRRMSGNNVLALTGDITKVGDWLGDSDVRVLRKSYLRARPEDLAPIVAAATLPNRDGTGNQTATGTKKAPVRRKRTV